MKKYHLSIILRNGAVYWEKTGDDRDFLLSRAQPYLNELFSDGDTEVSLKFRDLTILKDDEWKKFL